MEVTSTRRWLIMGAIALATLTVGLDTTVLNVALPTLAREIGADTAGLQWFSTSYTLTLAALMLPAGGLGDRFGRKRVFIGALILFGIASAGCAMAHAPWQLITARAVLGIGAAALMPLSTAVIAVVFPDPAERGRAIGVTMMMVMLGMPLGPILGGVLLKYFWWGSVFLINVPMVIFAIAAIATLLPESRSTVRHRLHLPSIVLSSVGLLGLTYGFIRIGEEGWGNGAAWGALAGGLALLTAFVLWQRRLDEPLIDLGLFNNDGFRWGAVYSVFMSFSMFGLMFTIPQYIQSVLGADALGSGLRQLPLVAGIILATRLVDKLEHRGPRPSLLIGFSLLAVGAGIGSLTTAHTGYWFAVIWIVIVGVGLGFVMPTSVAMAVGALSKDRAGSGSALLNAMRQAGGTIGVAVLGTVLATRYRSELGSLNQHPISDGVSPGVNVARAAGDTDMLDHIRTAFMGGMGSLLLVCAGICIAAVCLLLATGRRGAPAPAQSSPDTTEAVAIV
ncbi:MFS transporter [Nocardia sp. NPDC051030]|uniref:MFS transporter n=1 Tax=Nocardia sp. NPDC051030 TaxID=3155162 RepID=UPI00342F3C77